MTERRRFNPTDFLEDRLAAEAMRLRKEARGTPAGVERDRLLRLARQAETGSRIGEWLRSNGLQAPQ